MMGRNPERIDRIVETIRKAWKKYPDMRLTQLIENCFVFPHPPDKHCLYHVEDDELEAELNRTYGEK